MPCFNDDDSFLCEVCRSKHFTNDSQYRRCVCHVYCPETESYAYCDCCKICKYIATWRTNGRWSGYCDSCHECAAEVYHSFYKSVYIEGEIESVELRDSDLHELHQRVECSGIDVGKHLPPKPKLPPWYNELWHRLKREADEKQAEEDEKVEVDLLQCFAALML
jgi:hypothetical protein